MIIGIDPGKNTGVAIFENQKLVELKTFTQYGFILWFQSNIDKIKLAVFENSKGQSFIFTGSNSNKKVGGRIARNIGQIDGFCEVIKEMCEFHKIEYKMVSPLQKGKKIDHKTFIDFVPYYKKQTNQHERDSAQVVLKFNFQYLEKY